MKKGKRKEIDDLSRWRETGKGIPEKVNKRRIEKTHEKEIFKVRLRSKLPPSEYYILKAMLERENRSKIERSSRDNSAGENVAVKFNRITVESLLNSPESKRGNEEQQEEKLGQRNGREVG